MAAQSSPQQQQQQPPPQVTVTLEELREKGELQRSYYALLLGITLNNLTGSLLQLPAQVLDNIMTALAKGAATHVDPAQRKTCIQVCNSMMVGCGVGCCWGWWATTGLVLLCCVLSLSSVASLHPPSCLTQNLDVILDMQLTNFVLRPAGL